MLNFFKNINSFSFGFFPRIKSVFLIVYIFTANSAFNQQNLVPNGDFEEYWTCPIGSSNIIYPPFLPLSNPYSPKNWYDPNLATSDYYNTCSTLPEETGVPYNWFGYQWPHSGNAYCGFNGLAFCPMWCAEYIAVKLIEPLKANEMYCLSFWIVNSDSFNIVNNGLGAWFSQDSIHFSLHVPELGQVVFDTIISERINWTKLQQSFIAQGEESFMTIGNVSNGTWDSLHLSLNNPNIPNGSYYYIDDVFLVKGDCSDEDDEFIVPNVFTPNKDYLNDSWSFTSTSEIEVYIFNRWGSVVYTYMGKNPNWNGGNATDGIYYYKIIQNEEIKTGFIHLVR